MVTRGIERYHYDSDGRVTDIIDANGISYVHNEYDGKGRVTRQTLYDGQEYVMLYNDNERTNTYLTPGSGREVRYTYDRSRQLVCTGYQDGTTQERAYDIWENIVWEKDRNGNVTRRAYDEYGHLLEEEYADGLVVSYTYDATGNCCHMWDNGGTEIYYTYDNKGNLIEETEQIDNNQTRSAHYAYDRYGRVTAFTDANGHQETYTYDSGFWESTAFTTAAGSEYLHRLDRAGRCVAIEDADGESTYAYTCYDLLSMETDPLGHTTRYLYDNVSDLTGMVRPNQHTLNMSEEKMETYKNDAFHRRISRTDCTGAVLEYHYDANNRRIFEKRRISGTVEQIFRYLYDAGGRLIELNRTADKEGCGRQSVSVRYEYDKNGNNTKTILPTGAQILREYDAADRLVLERHVDKTCGIDNTTQFSYDKAGNLISMMEALQGSSMILMGS